MSTTEKQAGFTRAYTEAARKGTVIVDDAEAGVKVDHTKRAPTDPTKAFRERIASNVASQLQRQRTKDSAKLPLQQAKHSCAKLHLIDQLIGVLDTEVNTAKRKKALDVGCSIGGDLTLLKKALQTVGETNVELIGVDLLGAQLTKARECLTEGRFIEGNVTALPFSDNEMDSVQCSRLLIHIPDLATAVDEMVRVLRPGGFGVFAEGNMRAHIVFTSDERLRTVDAARNNHIIAQCANPGAAMEAYKLLLTRNDVENVEICPFNMLLSDPSYGYGLESQFFKPMLTALVTRKIITQQDVEYFIETLPAAQKAGDYLMSDTMFEVSFNKKI